MGSESQAKRVRRYARLGTALKLKPGPRNGLFVMRLERLTRGQQYSYAKLAEMYANGDLKFLGETES